MSGIIPPQNQFWHRNTNSVSLRTLTCHQNPDRPTRSINESNPMLKKSFLLGAALIATLAAPPAIAQQFKPSVLKVNAIRGGAFWLSGGVANSGFVVGDKGVIVIDTQVGPPDAKAAISEIAKVTPKPINAIIVSHGDPDHIGGLLAYPADAAVIEHEGTQPYVLSAANDAARGGPFGALFLGLVKRPPTRTIGNTEAVTLDGVRMVLMHLAPAHTDGDLVIYLPAQKTVFAADLLLTSQRFPVIHYGGSSLGWLATMKAMLALNADTYIPGHGPIESKAKLQARLRDVEQVREQIKAMVREGKTVAEVQTAIPEEASPFPTFVETIYRELTVGYPASTPPWANIVRPELMRR